MPYQFEIYESHVRIIHVEGETKEILTDVPVDTPLGVFLKSKIDDKVTAELIHKIAEFNNKNIKAIEAEEIVNLNKKAKAIESALMLMAAGVWDEFNPGTFSNAAPDFFNCILACNIEQLKKYKFIFTNPNFQANQNQVANRFKLFLKRKVKAKLEEENLFIDEVIHTLINYDNDSLYYRAQATLIAAGLWDQIMPGYTQNHFSFNQYLNDNNYYKEVVAELSEKELKAPWIKDFLAYTISFPVEDVKTAIEKNQKIKKPIKVIDTNGNDLHYTLLPYPVVAYKKDGKDYYRHAMKGEKSTHISYLALEEAKILGKGSFGSVYKGQLVKSDGTPLPSQPYAVKVIKKPTKESKQKLESEQAINQQEGGLPHGLPLFEDPQNYYLPMQFIPGESLSSVDESVKNYCQNLTFAERTRLLHEIAIAVTELHRKGLIHADIKWENLRIQIQHNQNKQKVFDVTFIDFGISVSTGNLFNSDGEIKCSSTPGTPRYMAPEILNSRRYSSKRDMYALTPLFISILGGSDPFQIKDANAHNDYLIVNASYDFKNFLRNIDFPQDYHYLKNYILSFVKRMQEADPKNRVSDNELFTFTKNLSEIMTILEILQTVQATEKPELEKSLSIKIAHIVLIADSSWKQWMPNKQGKIDLELGGNSELPDRIHEEYKRQYKKYDWRGDPFMEKFKFDLHPLNLGYQVPRIKSLVIQNVHKLINVHKLRDAKIDAKTTFQRFGSNFEDNFEFCQYVNNKYSAEIEKIKKSEKYAKKKYSPNNSMSEEIEGNDDNAQSSAPDKTLVARIKLDFYIEVKQQLYDQQGDKKKRSHFFRGYTTKQKLEAAIFMQNLLEDYNREKLKQAPNYRLIKERFQNPANAKLITIAKQGTLGKAMESFFSELENIPQLPNAPAPSA